AHMLVDPTPDGRGRKAAGVLAEQSGGRLLEVARGYALQVEDRDQHLEALRSTQLGLQIAVENRMRASPWPTRSRTRGARTPTGPMPVMISRSGKCPWRTNRCWPSSVKKPEFRSRKSEISASMACAKSFRAPLRKTSVSGSSNVPGSANLTILSWVTAYLPLMESGGSNTPTIRRLTSLRRHQLLPIAHGVHPR